MLGPSSGPGVGGDVVVEHHQQEQGDAQEVGEQGELDVRDHGGMFVVWKIGKARYLITKILVWKNNKHETIDI